MKICRGLFILTLLMPLHVTSLLGCGGGSSSSKNPGDTSPDSGSVLDTGVGDYPNAALLVSGEAFEAALGKVRKASGQAHQVNTHESNLVIIDARGKPDDTTAYETAHIPGAISLTWGEFGAPNLNPVPELENLLTNTGITRGMTIVIYDNTTASWGAAGRVFWTLEYLGCEDVHLLQGGWDKWLADGRLTETRANTLPDAPAFVAQVRDDIMATKEHVSERLEDDDFVIIDSRTDEEYIGWTLYGEARGGHVSGAVQIPYEWFFYEDKTILSSDDLQDLFESRGITPDKEVSSYCTAGIRSGFVYFALRLMGYPRCSNYDGSIYEWGDHLACPMDMMPNYEKLVYAQWVKELIDGGNPGTAGSPPTYPGNGYVILEAMSWRGGDNTDDYDAGHIPGAIHLNIYALEGGYPDYPYISPSDGNLLPDEELQTFIEILGIAHDTTVVIYSSSLVRAARAGWALMYAGVEDVRILNGGYDAWVANGGTEDTTPYSPSHVAFGADGPVHPEYLATTSDVEELRGDPTGVLADIRRWEEFVGDPGSNRYSHFGFDAEGRIPGSVWAYNSSEYVDAVDGTFRSYSEVEQMWWDLRIKPNKKIAFY